MAAKPRLAPIKLMEKAIKVMKQSVSEPREDGTTPPKVGAVLLKADGTIDSACRGELRAGVHAEYTLLERKNRSNALDGSVLYATLEPCAPGARHHPKLSCAERIVNARIKEVWVGCQDPHPKVAGKGIQFLQDSGVTVHLFDQERQKEIEAENAEFFKQAQAAAERKKQELKDSPSEHESVISSVGLEGFSPAAFDRYRLMLMGENGGTEDDFHQRLIDQGLLQKENGELRPTGFGMLLFASHPRDVMTQAGILGTLIKDGKEEPRDFDGPVVLAPAQVIQWLKDKLPNPVSRSQVYRKELNGTYYELVREGLVNALVHRDYTIENAKIQLVVEPDKILIRSPGEPMKPITLEQLQEFKAPTFSRNPRLHAAFNTMELAEEKGLGLRSMKNKAQKAKLPLPTYTWNAPYLDLTVYRAAEGVTEAIGDSVLASLSEAERKGWGFVASRGTTTQAEYSREFGIKSRTAQRHLSHFVKLGLLRRQGRGPSTEYRVISS